VRLLRREERFEQQHTMRGLFTNLAPIHPGSLTALI